MKNTVFLFVFIYLKVCTLQAQNLYVYQTNTAKNSYPLKEIKEITFVNREMYIIPPIADTALVRIPLADLRILSFTDYGGVSIAGASGICPEIRVYPNPTNGQLTISLPNPSEGGAYTAEVVEIYNVVGQKLNNCQFSIVNSQLIIDISHLANGMYFLKVGNKTARFVKE